MKLLQQLENVVPKGITLPKELKQLYQWIEDNNLYIDASEDERIGLLYPEKELKESWTETEREGGTSILFLAGGTENLKYWFGGEENKEVKEKLCVFAQSADGSECALWLTDNQEIKIVHMGSGSGSVLTCVLADNMIDFIRLLAIGYDEICWDENFAYPPNENRDNFLVKPNEKFQTWVRETFNVTIPQTALEIVKHPATMLDDSSDDEFFNWYKRYLN